MDEETYQPDYRLNDVYEDATQLTRSGLDSLCSSYLQLTEADQRYCDETLIGEGGMKKVYRAFDNSTKRWVALARLREDRGPEFYDRFIHEAWLTSSLQHPNIANVLDIGVEEDGRPFFTMGLKASGSLAELISSKPQIDLRDLLSIFVKVCDAVSYAHSRGIVHLDLKPENIQTAEYGEVLVSDWGLGKYVSEENLPDEDIEIIPEVRDNVTLFREIKGTPGYMAPEQMRSDALKDHRTDIFSLGCILHTIVTGTPPYTMTEVEAQTKNFDFDMALFIKAEDALLIPESLKAIVRKSLAIEPEARYANVTEIRKDTLRFLRGFTTEAENPNFFHETAAFIARNRNQVLASSLGLIVFTVLGTLGIQKIDYANSIAETERIRRTSLQNKAFQTAARYDENFSRVEREKEEAVKAYSESGKTLTTVAFFDRPIKTVEEAYKIARESLAFDPESRRARVELFYLNLITLNFKGVHEQPPPSDTLRYYYVKLADAFPEFDFDSERRPSVEELCLFLETARGISPKRPGFLERLLCYDHAAREDRDGYHLVVAAFVRYLNSIDTQVAIKKESGFPQYYLQSESQLRLLTDAEGSQKCVLRYLPIRDLAVMTSGEFDLSELNQLELKTLDLSGCKRLVVRKPLSFPNVTEIRVGEGQVDEVQLKQSVRTIHDFEVIVEAGS